MMQVRIGQGGWVLVCDGRKALFLENKGDAEYPDLRTREVREQPDLPTSKLGTDAPGRVHQSATTMRSAVEQTDWHDEAEKAFLGELVEDLDRALLARTTKELAIVAPARALGMMRKSYSKHIRQALVCEIEKDLVALPIKDIEAHLFGKRR